MKRHTYFPRQEKGEELSYIVSPKRWALLEVQFMRENVQRGEVFLYDAQATFPDFHMEVDEMISILLVDFIAQLRRGPMLIVEVLSPLATLKDLYQKYGVQEYWIIDPGSRTVHVYVRMAYIR